MRLTYFGHASFLVETRDGIRVILDPYVPGLLRRRPSLRAYR